MGGREQWLLIKTIQAEWMKVPGKLWLVFWIFSLPLGISKRDGNETVGNSGLAIKRDFQVNIYIKKIPIYIGGIAWKKMRYQKIDYMAYNIQRQNHRENTIWGETEPRWLRGVVSAIPEDTREKSNLKRKKLSCWQHPAPQSSQLRQVSKVASLSQRVRHTGCD